MLGGGVWAGSGAVRAEKAAVVRGLQDSIQLSVLWEHQFPKGLTEAGELLPR